MPNAIDIIIVRGTIAQFDSIPYWEKFAFRIRTTVNYNDGTYSMRGAADAAGQTELSNLGLTVTVAVSQSQHDQHLALVESQLPTTPLV